MFTLTPFSFWFRSENGCRDVVVVVVVIRYTLYLGVALYVVVGI